MAWTTLAFTDEFSLYEPQAQGWFGPDAITEGTATTGTARIQDQTDPLNPVATKQLDGTGTLFTSELTIGQGLYFIDTATNDEGVAKVVSITSDTVATLDRSFSYAGPLAVYTLTTEQYEKLQAKFSAIITGCKILEGLPGYTFPDTPTQCMQESNSLMAFEIFNGTFTTGNDPNKNIKTEKIGDYSITYQSGSDALATTDATGRGIPQRVQDCINQYGLESLAVGGCLSIEPDNGY